MSISQINIYWRDYKYFPYERKLALREIETLLSPTQILNDSKKLTVSAPFRTSEIEKLVYFSHAAHNETRIETVQHRAEIKGENKSKRQNTRYSVHGLHEYKGKFNPQVVKSLYNIYGVSRGMTIFDPFCGSGTSLIEAAHFGVNGYGTDINPLATFIANTKILCLRTSWKIMQTDFDSVIQGFNSERPEYRIRNRKSERIVYLLKWFPTEILHDIECIREHCANSNVQIADTLLVVLSNLLRKYSLQDPDDLRIRRRKSPLPEIPLINVFTEKMKAVIQSIRDFQEKFGIIETENAAFNADIMTGCKVGISDESIDFAITSPPYATALPYIDTQRLSLVWLSMIKPSEVRKLESELIGSREYQNKSDLNLWNAHLRSNTDGVSKEVFLFCNSLLTKLSDNDGFRKQAVPSLLYRYFSQMKVAFIEVKRKLKPGGHFALIVGHNHTNIGDKRTDIDTPGLLIKEALAIGYELIENTPLEVYQRYGINSLNAVNKESLIVFKRPN